MSPADADDLAREVADANFDDERLNERLKRIVATLATQPSTSLPRAFDRAGLEGAYRFFSNQRVTPEQILASHIEATRERCSKDGDFLVVHDSTAFSFRYNGEREGLEPLRRSNPGSSQALFAHVSLAVASDGSRQPLGLCALKHWTRDAKMKGMESPRWEEQILNSSANAAGHGRAIHVMDREADDYRMFHALLRDGHRFVARSQHNRWLESSTEDLKLHTLFEATSTTVERDISLSRRKQHRNPILNKLHPVRSAHLAKLSVAAASVALKRPATRVIDKSITPATLEINVVRVWEAEPPEGERGVEWYLFTSEPIETPEQQLAIVDHYRCRWVIEEYFKALKTGCAFESRQLQDYEGLVNLLAVFAPIACRMLLIRSEAHRVPDANALTVLSQDHLDVLRAKGRSKLGASPTTREVYRAIAELGGYIKYSKQDPGWLTLARGLEDLETLVEGWRLAKLQLASDQR